MEHFIDGWCVRLRNHQDGRYLYADEDGVAVSMKPHGASLNAAWKVHRVQRGGDAYVLLQGAAYGQYLALELRPVQRVYPLLVQRSYENPGQNDVLWVVANVEGVDGAVVFIHDFSNPRQYLTVVSNGIACEHWMFDILLPRPDSPEPLALQPHVPELPGVEQPQMMISYVLADDLGNFEPKTWLGDMFPGRSVYNLRRTLAGLLERDVTDISLCVRGGALGRLTHLLIDLPTGHDAFEIIVLLTQSTANLMLWDPNVDGQ